MEKIDIKEIINLTLYKKFVKWVGKYIFFKTCIFGKEEVVIWFIEEVIMKDKQAKIRMNKYSPSDNGYTLERLFLIKNLRSDWTIANKKELNRILILQNLK
jgi:hypothetical protein